MTAMQGVAGTAVLIAGPTASGKSGVAMTLARRHGGVIVNADALQVYRDLYILSARPDEADERAVPHRLYGMVAGSEAWSVGKWLAAARDALTRAWAEGRLPVVIGGTGLYFRALEQGLSPLPAIPGDIREKWRARLKAEGAATLRRDLMRLAPDEPVPADPHRLVRALEVLEVTGEPLSVHHARAASGGALAGARVVRVAIVPDRAELYRRCDARFDAMMAAGALDEVRRLAGLALPADRPVMKAIGVASLLRVIEGTMSREDAMAEARKLTRNYAKRQMTWIRGQMRHWPIAVTPHEALERLEDELVDA